MHRYRRRIDQKDTTKHVLWASTGFRFREQRSLASGNQSLKNRKCWKIGTIIFEEAPPRINQMKQTLYLVYLILCTIQDKNAYTNNNLFPELDKFKSNTCYCVKINELKLGFDRSAKRFQRLMKIRSQRIPVTRQFGRYKRRRLRWSVKD